MSYSIEHYDEDWCYKTYCKYQRWARAWIAPYLAKTGLLAIALFFCCTVFALSVCDCYFLWFAIFRCRAYIFVARQSAPEHENSASRYLSIVNTEIQKEIVMSQDLNKSLFFSKTKSMRIPELKGKLIWWYRLIFKTDDNWKDLKRYLQYLNTKKFIAPPKKKIVQTLKLIRYSATLKIFEPISG